MKYKKSIQLQSKRLIHILYGIFLLFVLSLATIILCQLLITSLEKESKAFFTELNKMALLIQRSEGVSDKTVVQGYADMQQYQTDLVKKPFTLNKIILPDIPLALPDYSSLEEMEEYRGLFREYASSVRKKSYAALNALLWIIYALLGVIFIFFLLVFILIIRLRTALDHYISSIDDGIEAIEALLNFEPYTPFHVDDKVSQEVLSYSETVRKIETDIELDHSLENLDSVGNLADSLEYLVPLIQSIVPFDRLAFAFLDIKGRITAEAAYTNYKKVFLEPGISEEIGNTSLSHVIRQKRPRVIHDLPAYSKGKNISESTKMVLQEGIKTSLTVPLFIRDRCIGFLFFASKKQYIYKDRHIVAANRVGNKLKSHFYLAFMAQELIAETANSFVGLMNEKDNETSAHLQRMSKYSYIIAQNLSRKDFSLKPGFAREIYWFAPLHDIGKIGIPDSILLKPGTLSVDEFNTIKGHVLIGERIIKNMNSNLGKVVDKPMLDTAVDIITGHHEKYNGSGYPLGLKGRAIPLAGRIVAIADVFDALTSERPYKKAFSVDEALDIMQKEMLGSFDPHLLECFEDSMEEILEVYQFHKDD